MHSTTHIDDLGDWVEVRTEPTRRGQDFIVAVNRRTGDAIQLDGLGPHELTPVLRAGGFLRNQPTPVDAPPRSRLLTALRTLDVRWNGADRLVRTIHRLGGARAWTRPWLALQVIVALGGVAAFVAATGSGRPLHLRPEPWEVPIYIAISLTSVAIHELGHALVLAHHDRKVAAVGLRLHLGSPAFYVESVEALLLTRRQRMIQAAAGPWAEWLFTSIIAIALWIVPDNALTPVIHRFVIFGVVTIALNLLPFAGLDGSFLLADLIREPNLTNESKSALHTLLADRRPASPLLTTYAIANTLVSAVLLLTSLGLWIVVFGDLIDLLAAHGPLGWLGIAAITGLSFGPALIAALAHTRTLRTVDRALFRLERRRRITLTEHLATHPSFAHLDDRALSILAGQLQLHRINRNTPLHAPAFNGIAIIDGPTRITGDTTTLHPRIHSVTGSGIAATTSRLRPRPAALLDDDALRLVGIDAAALG